jgi:hypothetical protein
MSALGSCYQSGPQTVLCQTAMRTTITLIDAMGSDPNNLEVTCAEQDSPTSASIARRSKIFFTAAYIPRD